MREEPRRDGRDAELEAQLATTWDARGIDVDDLTFRGDTIVAPLVQTEASLLPALLSPPEDGAPPQLELGELLGEGGMGVVRSAVQTSLHREVAVKSLRPQIAARAQGAQLLREGRVTGLVEHPNVVPIHALGRDEHGRPMLVMKRIEGTPWARLLDEASPEERASAPFLRTHLGILKQVATAVDFAHSRGVLHRDIKPSNVMIGAFGEVYVLDWGIAVSTREDRMAGVPHVGEVEGVEGSPVYMAPEMVAGIGAELGTWSDVFLLGATLHHVITGEPPHTGPNLQSTLVHAFVSAPKSYRDEVPQELAEIARRAMARDPARRYRSASELGAALDSFLEHAESLSLSLEAERRADELTVLAMEGADPADTDATERIETLFHEARFGFEQALRSWPDNERAVVGRRDLLETMCVFELKRDAPRSATTLLRQHDDPPEALVRRAEAALEGQRAREQRLAELEHDVDRGFGATLRVKLAVAGAIVWAGICFTAAALTRYDVLAVNHQHFALACGVLLSGAVVSMLVAREQMLANANNIRVAFTTVLVFGSAVVMWPLLGALGMTMPQTSLVGACVGTSLWATGVLHLGRSWVPMPIGHAVAALFIWLWPAYHFELFALTAVSSLVTGWLMHRETSAAEPRAPRA